MTPLRAHQHSSERFVSESAERSSRSLVSDLIRALAPNPKGLRRWAVMRAIRLHHEKARLPLPDKFEDAVERAFLQNCESADAFKKRNCPDDAALFFWPQGKAGGVWAVHASRAEAWAGSNEIQSG